LRRVVALPVAFNPFQPLDFSGRTINALPVYKRTRCGIAAAFGVVNFAENKLKISVGRLFGAVVDTIQRNSARIDTVVLNGALEQGQAASSSSGRDRGPA
jgi:hypothetical protein